MNGTIKIMRCPKGRENPYVMTRRATAQDSSISWEAGGLLWYLLSKPDNWRVQVSDLINQERGAKRDKIYRMLRELIDAGYIVRQQTQDEQGNWSHTEYLVYEEPIALEPVDGDPTTQPEEPDTSGEIACTEKAYTEKPDTYIRENLLHKTEKTTNGNLSNTDQQSELPRAKVKDTAGQLSSHPLVEAYTAAYDDTANWAHPPLTKTGMRKHINALLDQGATPDEVAGITRDALTRNPGDAFPFYFVASRLTEYRQKQAQEPPTRTYTEADFAPVDSTPDAEEIALLRLYGASDEYIRRLTEPPVAGVSTSDAA